MKEVSVIIVVYKAENVTKKCLASIPNKDAYEVIVVNNTKNNRGFGNAANLGAQQATGKYLFFLNPDAKISDDTIKKLVKKITSNVKIGIVAPQLIESDATAYLSYSKQPRWYSAPIIFSFIRNLLPRFLRCKLHHYEGDSLIEEKYVEAVSGAAFLIEKKLFTKIGGFDPLFFMYWEDFDLCKRITNQGKKILYCPSIQVMHIKAGSTTDKRLAQTWFQQSRYQYFKKYFGSFYALSLESFLRLTEAV